MSLIMMTMGVGVMVMLLMRIHSRSWTKCPMAPTKHAEKNLTDVRDWLCSTFGTNTSWAADSEGDAMEDSWEMSPLCQP